MSMYEAAKLVAQSIDGLTEAVRALKPAPYAQPIEKLYAATLQENGQLQAEVERLRVENAVFKATEASFLAMNAELQRLRVENAELEARRGHVESAVEQKLVELQRFREREEKVQELVRLSKSDHFDDDCEECLALDAAAAAVRDFKMTP